jgi:signal transduction histidine kinase
MSRNTDIAIAYANNALEWARIMNNDSLISSSLFILGRSYGLKKSYKIAEKYFLKILEINKQNKNQIITISSIFELGQIYFDIADFEKALEYYEESLNISININHKPWRAISLDAIGATYYALGNFNDALQNLNESIKIYKTLKDYKNVVRILYGQGASYTALSMYDKAIDYLLESLQMSQDLKYVEYESLNNHAIAMIYERLKNYKIALNYNKIALNLANESHVEYLIGDILLHMGKIYYHTASYDTSRSFVNKSLKVQEKIYDNIGISNVFDLLGDIYLKKNQINKAFENYVQARKVLENIDHKYRQTKITNHLGVVYAKMGNNIVAGKYLHKSLDDARKIGAQDMVQKSLSSLSDYYATLNDHKTAYRYLKEFTHLNDSIFTTSSHHIAEMQIRYETGKREKENELLKNKINIQNLEIEKGNLKNWLSYLSLAILSIIGFFSYNRYKAKKKLNILLENKIKDAIKKHHQQQEIIFHQANLSSLGELAAGMAHEINQPLQAIKLSTESLDLDIRELNVDTSSMKENISEIYQGVERAKNIIDHVRIFASQQKNHIDEYFRPSIVLQNALSLVGKQYLKKEILVRLKLNKRIGKIRGNPYKYEQIVFNLLSNAKDALLEKEIKLNQPFKKEIEIRTFRDENDIVLLVKDNGIGMSKEHKDNIFRQFYTTKNLGAGTGLGLSIVFGLVKEMDGRILVSSDYKTGTSVQVRIPRAVLKNNKTEKSSVTRKIS